MYPSRQIRTVVGALLAALLTVTVAHADEDPPGRVARLSYMDGSVTFAPAGSDDWAYATINRPFTTGDRLWVDQGGRAELHVGQTALHISSQTSLDVLTLDDNNLQLKMTQGKVNLHVRRLWEGQSIEIDTPNLAFIVRQAGDYRVDVDTAGNTTGVSVRRGLSEVYGGNNASTSIPAGQSMRFGGNDLSDVEASGTASYDGFDRWAEERDAREDSSQSAQYVSRDMVGYEDLDNNGSWHAEEGYGEVWYPTATVVGWAPYRYGHWAWIAPWGWTWVDDASWGFAPFHYGRWAYINGAWGWVPGPMQVRPYYAPALVAFVGGGGHFGISLSAGVSGVAWFPLGPGEVYRPAYAVSPTYVNNINHTTIINNTVVNNTTVINNVNVNKTVYVNQQAPNGVTAVSSNAFVSGTPVHHAIARFDPATLQNAQVGVAPTLAPVKQSITGGAKPAVVPPPAVVGSRQVVATRAPAVPPALHDSLAKQYVAQGNVVHGVGPLPQNLTNPQPSIAAVNHGVTVVPTPASLHTTNVTNIGQPHPVQPAVPQNTSAPHPAMNTGVQPSVAQGQARPNNVPTPTSPMANSPVTNASQHNGMPQGANVQKNVGGQNAYGQYNAAQNNGVPHPPTATYNPQPAAPTASRPVNLPPVNANNPHGTYNEVQPHEVVPQGFGPTSPSKPANSQAVNGVPHPPAAYAQPAWQSQNANRPQSAPVTNQPASENTLREPMPQENRLPHPQVNYGQNMPTEPSHPQAVQSYQQAPVNHFNAQPSQPAYVPQQPVVHNEPPREQMPERAPMPERQFTPQPAPQPMYAPHPAPQVNNAHAAPAPSSEKHDNKEHQ